MRLLLYVSTDNEWADDDCDAAYLDLTPELAKIALARVELCQKLREADKNFTEAYFWDYSVTWFSPWKDGSDGEAFEKITPSGDSPIYHMTDEDPDPTDAQTARTECDQMIVSVEKLTNGQELSEIRFTTIPKFCSHYVRTTAIGVDMLRQVLDAAAAAGKEVQQRAGA